jgi:hypothetical protein
MRRFSVVLIAVSAFLLSHCKGSEPSEPTEGGAEPGAEEQPAQPAADPEQAYLMSISGLRRQPTEDRKVTDEAGKSVRNWQTTLFRGEELTVLEVEGGWARAKASDDSVGWVQKEYLLPTEGVRVATVFEEIKTFGRPDLLTLNASLALEPGSLLFVLKTKDQFSEVNRFGQRTTWVLSEKINSEAAEVAAAKLLAKAKWLESKKDPSAEQVLDLAKTQFGTTRLIGMLAASGEEPQEAEGEVAADEAAPAEGEETKPGEDI